jgi:hypothetical protein
MSPLFNYKLSEEKVYSYLSCGRKAEQGKGDNECYSETEKIRFRNVSWGETREGSPLPRRLKWPMK